MRVLRFSGSILREAVRGLLQQRLRAGLSMLGLSWGIVTVVILLAYGNGLHNAIEAGFRGAFGDGVVVMYGGQTSMQAGGERSGRPIRLELEDVALIRAQPMIREASPEYIRTLSVSYGTRQTSAAIRGVAPSYGKMRCEQAGPGQGRFINLDDVSQRARVAFLGREVHRKLFGNFPAVGESIRIGGLSFEVIGVMDDKVQMSSYYSPDMYCVFIPYTTVGDLWDPRFLYTLVFQSVDSLQQPRAVEQVRGALGRRHRFNPADTRALLMNDSVEISTIINGITGGLKLVLTFIGILTLGIGGVGVMNIMFVSVTDRTREIGVRKALGARRRDILLQFLAEGVATCLIGGTVGMALSAAIISLKGPMPLLADFIGDPQRVSDIHFVFSAQVMVFAAVILMLVGLVSSLLPAVRAARLDPIASLRYE
jgi:putative ABC transport system permease protein